MKILRDERGVVLSWLLTLTVMLALLGVVIFEAGSIATNYFTLDSTADDIAIAVSTEVGTGGPSDVASVTQQAKVLADEAGAKLLRATIDREGIIHIRLRREAKTLVVGHVEMTEDWAIAVATGRASTN